MYASTSIRQVWNVITNQYFSLLETYVALPSTSNAIVYNAGVLRVKAAAMDHLDATGGAVHSCCGSGTAAISQAFTRVDFDRQGWPLTLSSIGLLKASTAIMLLKLNFDKVHEEMKDWEKRCVPVSNVLTTTNHRKKEKSKEPAFINEMPTEMVLDIFSQAIPSSAINPFDTTAGPWVLSKVCKKWNSIITTYAPLWTNITIDTSPKAIEVSKPYDECLLDVLKHPQDQPLSIRFVEGEDSIPSDTHMLLYILVKHAPCWKKLDFTFSKPETMAVLDHDTVGGPLNSLESLKISGSPGMIADMPLSATPCRVFADSPKLRSADVSLGGFTLELPFAQLKSFNDHWRGSRAREMSIPEGVSKYLQEMGQVYVRLFDKEFREANLSALLFLIEQSGCASRKITLRDCIPVVNEFVSILRASPTLEELTLIFAGWNDMVNSCLLEILPSIHIEGGGEGEGGMLVPHLTKLSVIVQHKPKSRTVPSMSFFKDTLIDAVENRRNHQVAGVAKLERVLVWGDVVVEQGMVVSPGAGNVERWNRLKKGGMGALFYVIGGKADDEWPPAGSCMIHVNPDPKSPAYLRRQYV
ncbi:hypothetical protein EV421DRAFT_2020266 [Armillaria borealis]|uniref:F-box domain-containing protein n=1 Tax=Armillaria borealis TaxID=47425 RepID=A0AA39JDL9_9AGAR|nr:hypothetical protein EV421DRAFT_2020266 [Armillaria borealis]